MVIAADLSGARDEYDICVVGAGPAGLCVALHCARNGLSVLLLEAGDMKPHPASSASDVDRISDETSHLPLSLTTRRSFGGTSWVWGGLCVPLDPLDLEERPWVPFSGWPIDSDELDRWNHEAADFLGCGRSRFSSETAAIDQDGPVRISTFGRISSQPNLAMRFRHEIEESERIYCCLAAGVREVEVSPETGRVTRLVGAGGRSAEQLPRARQFVLAAGGVETTRILLNTQLRVPALAGGADGALGRFYMGHVAGQLATLVFRKAETARGFLYRRDEDGPFLQKRFTLSEAAQRRHELLNTAFTLRFPPASDSRHKSGILSLLHLLLRVTPDRMAARSMKLQAAGPEGEAPFDLAHLRNVVSRPFGLASDFARIVRRLKDRHMPVLLANPGHLYSLRYHAEQAPDRESRISLRKGPECQPGDGLLIDLRYSPFDAASVVRAHVILDEALRSAEIGRLEYHHDEPERERQVAQQARDGYHQIGTTRMGIDPRTSVVDPDCRVHGLENLFVASSSVFPTSGAANPTFPMICLAFRLADHLCRILEKGRR